MMALAILPIVSFYVGRRYQKRVQRFFSGELIGKLSNRPWKRAMRLKTVLLYAGIGLLIVGLAGPKIGSEIREVKRQGVDLLIALDVSLGMHAEDVRPSRLEKAKFEIQRLVGSLRGDRVGLLLFTNTAFLQCPLTSDYSAFRMYLDIASTDQLPSTGTNYPRMLREAKSVFENTGEQQSNAARVLLIFSDGEDHSAGFERELNELTAMGVHIYTVGIGTPQGAAIPIYDRRTGALRHYHRDREGRVVNTRLEPDNLRKLAEQGRGTYYEIRRPNDRIDGFISKLDELERSEFATELYSDFKNRYQYPAAAGLFLIVLSIVLPGYRKAEMTEQ